MARPSLFHHRKFLMLAQALKSRAIAAGSLELLWAVANDAGNPVIGSAEVVEYVADWRGKPGALAASLVAAGFLDETDGTLSVHDHAHHCPRYVRRRRDREAARRLDPTGQEAAGDEPLTGHGAATDRPAAGHRASLPTPNSQLPSPRERESGSPVPLTGRRNQHIRHALCGRPCVPEAIYRDMVEARGGDADYVTAYVHRVQDAVAQEPVPLDTFKFWRERWDRDHCRHEPEQQYKRAWECRRCGGVHDGSEAQFRAGWCPAAEATA